MSRLQNEFQNFLRIYRDEEPINNQRDYHRVKRWVRNTIILYSVWTIIGIAMGALAAPLMGAPTVVCIFVLLLSGWGFAAICMNFKLIMKSVFSSGKAGYEAGKQIQTTHVNITHEYGDTYKVNTYTENEGCITAIFMAFFKFFLYVVLAVYVAPFLTFKKLFASISNIKDYNPAH